MVNVFIGLSIGANVLVARYYGARDEKNLEETVHIAMVIAVVGGLLLIAVGELLTKPILILMGSPGGCASTGSVIYENLFSWNAGNAGL